MKNNQFKYISIFVVFVLLLARLFFVGYRSGQNHKRNEQRNANTEARSENPASTGNYNGASYANDLNRNASHIIYSKHARCRMECRHIDEQEVRQILATGTINTRKIESDSRGKTYPLEGVINGDHLRIVFANKGADAVEVVTCIDLNTEWQCDCH